MRVTNVCGDVLLVEDRHGTDVPVSIMSDVEIIAGAQFADAVVAVTPEARSEPGGLRDVLILVEQMRSGDYVPDEIENGGRAIEPELAHGRSRLRTDGWRLLGASVDCPVGDEDRRVLLLAAVRQYARATIRVDLRAEPFR